MSACSSHDKKSTAERNRVKNTLTNGILIRVLITGVQVINCFSNHRIIFLVLERVLLNTPTSNISPTKRITKSQTWMAELKTLTIDLPTTFQPLPVRWHIFIHRLQSHVSI